MIKVIAVIVALVFFCFWMSIVGNPHVAETCIGLVLSFIAGFWVNSSLKKIFKKKDAQK